MSLAFESPGPRTSMLRSPRRLALAAMGVACVALAFVGVFVPGLPTTVFLIVASYLFARSCPWLEERLVRARVFRPFLPYVVGDRPMPLRARIAAAAMMWTAVGASLAALGYAGRLGPGVAAAILAAAVAGTVAIARVRRAV